MSVVIPTRNEADNIPWVLRQIPSFVREVIIVDGLSTDGTVETARAVRPDVVVTEAARPGKGAALQAGFAAATGEVIVMLDADCSMDPAEISRMVEHLGPDVGLVKGSRFLPVPGSGTSDMTMLRRLGNESLLRLVNRLNDSALTDLCYGYCAFRRADLEALSIDAVGFEVETQMILHALRANLRIEEVPSFEAPRHSGASKLHPCRDGMRVLRTVAHEQRARHAGRPSLVERVRRSSPASLHVVRPGAWVSRPAPALPTWVRMPEAARLLSLPVLALLLWALSLGRIDTAAMGGTGLVSVLPFSMLLALAVLTVSFVLCLSQDRSAPVLALHIAVLLVMLHATTAIAEPEPAFETAYRHVGIADFIQQTGGIDTTIDGYFNWPTFFGVAAVVAHEAGLPNALGFVPWAPLFYNVLYVAPLLLIFGALDVRRRVIWLALFVFFVTDWTAQDYFSPQATAYLLYLVVIGVLLRWFTPPLESISPVRRVGLLAIAIGGAAAVVGMHQLTPFALLASVTALVLFAGCTARLLPVLLAVMIAGWDAYIAVSFLSGHFTDLLGAIGNVRRTVSSNVGARVGGDTGHRLVVEARLLLTASVCGMAAIGWWLQRRSGRPIAAVTALALAPVPLLVLQPYGGEILIRVFLFMLPFVALLAASGLVEILETQRAVAIAGTAAATLALLGGFLFARFGNERMDSFSSGDVAAVKELYGVAPPGSQLLAASQPLPWRSQDYNNYHYQTLNKMLPPVDPRLPHQPVSAQIRTIMLAAAPRHSYVIVTRSQLAGDDLIGTRGIPARLVEERLNLSKLFQVVYGTPEATIFTLNPLGASGRWRP